MVTNMRGSYNEHLSTHAVTFLLTFARRFDVYLPQKRWQRGPTMVHLPDTTVLIVGVGGSGSEASKQCAAFGMRVLGCDPRTTELAPGMGELFTPDTLPTGSVRPISSSSLCRSRRTRSACSTPSCSRA
jgi:phosphoglycerate dehydrogenase-like enzyme